MTTYVWRNGRLVNKATGRADRDSREPFVPRMPYVVSDIAPYRSVVSNKMVDGRLARREDLKRTGCRPVDPTEYVPTVRSEKWAKRLNLPIEAAKPPEFDIKLKV